MDGGRRSRWTAAADARLKDAVPAHAFDFDAVADALSDIQVSADACRMRFAELHGLMGAKVEAEEEDEEAEEDKPLRWTIELDRMLVETVVAEAYDFDAVGELLGERLGRKRPVPAKLCRLRYAAVDRNMVIETSPAAAPSAPSTPAAALSPASISPILSETAARKQDALNAGKFGEASVMLSLPPDDVMQELAAAFGGQTTRIRRDDDTKVDDSDGVSSKSGTASASEAAAAGATSSGMEEEPSGERSELQQVLDFLENHSNSTPAGGDHGGGNSFEELFGIPEAMLDRSVAVAEPEENDITTVAKEEEDKLFVDRGHFDLSDPRYAATFDRVARAIGAYD